MNQQFIVFNIDNEEYAIDIIKIHEIDRLKDLKINKLSKIPNHVEGIINLRGEIVPIINLRKSFSIPSIDITKDTRIIIVRVNNNSIGLLVDSVSNVLEINNNNDILATPEEISNKNEYIAGIIKKDKRIIFILDIEKAVN